VDDLMPWLREQIAETRRIATDAIVRKSGGDTWAVEEPRIAGWGQDEQDIEVIGGGKPIVQCSYEYGGPMIAAHIAEHDPRTVLAQCDAHEAILNEHTPRVDRDGDQVCTTCVYFGDDEDEGGNRFRYREHDDWPCSTVRALALAYQHRPGYREEWRP
jgi:hypothetical protein